MAESSLNPHVTIGLEQAREALSRGDRIRMVVGEAAEDPTLILYLEDGMVIAEAVAGWSAGVVEPVCALGSDFLRTYLLSRHSVELLPRVRYAPARGERPVQREPRAI